MFDLAASSRTTSRQILEDLATGELGFTDDVCSLFIGVLTARRDFRSRQFDVGFGCQNNLRRGDLCTFGLLVRVGFGTSSNSSSLLVGFHRSCGKDRLGLGENCLGLFLCLSDAVGRSGTCLRKHSGGILANPVSQQLFIEFDRIGRGGGSGLTSGGKLSVHRVELCCERNHLTFESGHGRRCNLQVRVDSSGVITLTFRLKSPGDLFRRESVRIRCHHTPRVDCRRRVNGDPFGPLCKRSLSGLTRPCSARRGPLYLQASVGGNRRRVATELGNDV